MFDSFISKIIAGQVRAAIATAGGALAAEGILSGEQTTALAGIAASLAVGAWSWFSKVKTHKTA